VTWSFIRTGELPHHDHGHVDGLEENPDVAETFRLEDNMHPHDLKYPEHHPEDRPGQGGKKQ